MKTTNYIIILLLVIFLHIGNAFAQQQLVQGQRTPRLTTEQRDQISVNEYSYANGLLIYNLDIDCLEYWDGEKWITLCQGSLNCEVDIPQPACNNIRVYGKYYKNAPLNNEHYIILPITVTKKGNYSIIATGNNGYYFQANGVFEETGVYELRLDGMGTPGINRLDEITFTCNGTQIGTLCNITINVEALTMGYRTDCDNIQVMGSYQARRFMDSDNIVKVPIEVLQTGTTTIHTDMQNGLRFSVTQTLDVYGPDTLIFRAEGSPKQEGTFKFTFTTDGSIKTTCSFEVNCFSLLGTFADPACKCLDIYEERPFVDDGEYWLLDCVDNDVTTPVKTFCDIKNGGWTLVWSYSEKTAREIYVQSTTTGGTGNANSMIVSGAYWSNFQDRPTNRVTTESGTINYNNYRLSRAEWRHFPINTNTPQLKVRITENPTDMRDEWAMNNYGIISPRNTNENPIETNFADYRLRVPAEGKIFGKQWRVTATGGGGYGGWDEVSGNRGELVLYSSTNYCTHWNFSRLGSGTQFEVVPNRGGANNTIAMNRIDNSFGWFGETQANHHFGKCGGTSGDEYSFATKDCAGSSLVPHTSINGGEGRILQWFVK